MPQYKIYWDVTGVGKTSEVIEAADHDEAVNMAYEAARDDFESQADYGAEEFYGDEDEE